MAAGMSEGEFEGCLKNQALFDKVKAMRAEAAAKLKVDSTPMFFIDGVELQGEHALDEIDQIFSAKAK
jgi:protein-disulfide isomerase